MHGQIEPPAGAAKSLSPFFFQPFSTSPVGGGNARQVTLVPLITTKTNNEKHHVRAPGCIGRGPIPVARSPFQSAGAVLPQMLASSPARGLDADAGRQPEAPAWLPGAGRGQP